MTRPFLIAGQEVLETVYSIAPLTACGIVLAIAIWKGGATEQAAAGLTALAWSVYIVVHAMIRAYALGLFVIDLVLLIAFAVILWRSRRDWPLATLAFQGVAVAVDTWYLLDERIPVEIYYTAGAVSSFGVLASIVFGIWDFASRRGDAGKSSH